MSKPLPPTVGERLARCGTHVEVWGIVPGADVTLEVAGAQQTLTVNSTAMTFTVGSLATNAGVRARQRVAADISDWSNVVLVEDVQLPPSAPVTERTISGCAHCISAWGAAPGSRIEITHGSLIMAEGEISRSGVACMEMKFKPADLRWRSATITCGVPSPGKGNIGIYSSPSPLPPPVIVEPVFECQSKIGFQNLVPGATVEIFVRDRDDVTSSLGTFCACSSWVNANIGRQMKKGDRLMAIQTMINDRWQCQVQGTKSAEVTVVPPDSRIKPKILEPVYEGDPMILVTNQIEGGIDRAAVARVRTRPEEDLGSRPSSEFPEVPVPDPGLHADQVLRVMQELCGVQEFSDPVTVQKRPPIIDPPVIRKPLFGCGEIVAVDNVIPGAWVFVRQTPPGLMSPEYPIGKAKAIGSSVSSRCIPSCELTRPSRLTRRLAENPAALLHGSESRASLNSLRRQWCPRPSSVTSPSGSVMSYLGRTSGSSIMTCRWAAEACLERMAQSAFGGRFRTEPSSQPHRPCASLRAATLPPGLLSPALPVKGRLPMTRANGTMADRFKAATTVTTMLAIFERTISLSPVAAFRYRGSTVTI